MTKLKQLLILTLIATCLNGTSYAFPIPGISNSNPLNLIQSAKNAVENLNDVLPQKRIEKIKQALTAAENILKGYGCIKIDIQLSPANNPASQKLKDAFADTFKKVLQTTLEQITEKKFKDKNLQICVTEDCQCSDKFLTIQFKQTGEEFVGKLLFIDNPSQEILSEEDL
jgi:ABC-type proline/glycine betaine transport system substrate-binding protein